MSVSPIEKLLLFCESMNLSSDGRELLLKARLQFENLRENVDVVEEIVPGQVDLFNGTTIQTPENPFGEEFQKLIEEGIPSERVLRYYGDEYSEKVIAEMYQKYLKIKEAKNNIGPEVLEYLIEAELKRYQFKAMNVLKKEWGD
jgi:hypothetical protein